MNQCLCGCGALVKGRWKRGHHKRSEVVQQQDGAPEVNPQPLSAADAGAIPALGPSEQCIGYANGCLCPRHNIVVGQPSPRGDCPPDYPLPFDHGKYRVAEEPIGTDMRAPWVLGYCLECKSPTWTHNARMVEKNEVLCETDAFMLLTELAEKRVQQENRPAQRRPIDPFES